MHAPGIFLFSKVSDIRSTSATGKLRVIIIYYGLLQLGQIACTIYTYDS